MVSSIRHQTHKQQMSNRHVGLHQTQQLSRTKNTIQGVKRQPTEQREPMCELRNREGSGIQSTERTLTAPQRHDNPISKRAKDFYRQMAKDHTKRCSASSVIREMHITPPGWPESEQPGRHGSPALLGSTWKAAAKQHGSFPEGKHTASRHRTQRRPSSVYTWEDRRHLSARVLGRVHIIGTKRNGPNPPRWAGVRDTRSGWTTESRWASHSGMAWRSTAEGP